MCDPFFTRILVGVDGDGASLDAVKLAGRLAKAFSAKVMLMHVVNLPMTIAPEWPPAWSDVSEKLRESARRLLEVLSRQVPAGVEVMSFVNEGFAAAEILKTADEWQADLIILGTRGQGRLSHFIAGSTCEAVIHGATCCVLVCPESAAARMACCVDQNTHDIQQAERTDHDRVAASRVSSAEESKPMT